MSTQHIATLLGATCCARLATMLRRVATCWVLLAQLWRWSNLSQQHPTCRNTAQHGGQTRATCCAQQCCDMLRWYVAIVWSGLKKRNSLYLKPQPNDRNMSTQHIATLLGATCCVWPPCCVMLGVVGLSLKMVKFEPTTPKSSSSLVGVVDVFCSTRSDRPK